MRQTGWDERFDDEEEENDTVSYEDNQGVGLNDMVWVCHNEDDEHDFHPLGIRLQLNSTERRRTRRKTDKLKNATYNKS